MRVAVHARDLISVLMMSSLGSALTVPANEIAPPIWETPNVNTTEAAPPNEPATHNLQPSFCTSLFQSEVGRRLSPNALAAKLVKAERGSVKATRHKPNSTRKVNCVAYHRIYLFGNRLSRYQN